MKKLLTTLLLVVLAICSLGLFACDEEEEPSGEYHSHKYTVSVVAPNCTDQGYDYYVCFCGESYQDNLVPALGHEFLETAYVSDKNATYEADGTKTATCNREGCFEKHTLPEFGSKLIKLQNLLVGNPRAEMLLGDSGTLDVNVYPSNASNKNYTLTSSNPEIVQVEGKKLVALAEGEVTVTVTSEDGFVQSVCTVSVGTLAFELVNNNSAYIVKDCVKGIAEFNVPNMHNGLSVIGVGEGAFRNNLSLTTITLPNTILGIDKNAFRDCANLATVNMPESIFTVADGAFYGCTALKTINLLGVMEKVGNEVFKGCTALETVNLGNAIKTIGNNAFEDCSAMQYVNLPNSLTSLGEGAFQNATALKDIDLSEGLSELKDVTFQGCTVLEEIIILDNISKIGTSVFSDCSALERVGFEGNVVMGAYAFYRCENINAIYYGANNFVEYGDQNYIFYDAGKSGAGITLMLPSTAKIPNGLFTPCLDENYPNITKLVIESESSSQIDTANVVFPYITEFDVGDVDDFNFTDKFMSACQNAFEVQDGVTYYKNWIISADADIENVVIKEGTTAIRSSAFTKYSEIKTLSIPQTLTDIDIALLTSSTLESITVAENNSVYTSKDGVLYKNQLVVNVDHNVKNVEFKDGTTEIHANAFEGCSQIESINIPLSLKDEDAVNNIPFGDFDKLKTVNVAEYHKAYSSRNGILYNVDKTAIITIPKKISGAVEISKNITSIDFSAFTGNTELTKIVLPNVQTIGEVAFRGCTSLTEVVLGDGVQTIDVGAFRGCTKLSTVNLGNGLQALHNNAFDGCTLLETIVIPASVTTIYDNPFNSCNNLRIYCGATTISSNWNSSWNNSRPYVLGFKEEVVEGDFVYAIYNVGSGDFATVVDYTGTVTVVDNMPTTVKYKNGVGVDVDVNVTEILGYAFSGTNVTEVTIPTGVTTIGARAFSGCTSLENVEISDTVTTIGNMAFYDCDGLDSIIIPDTVTTMGRNIFAECAPDLRIYCEATTGWGNNWYCDKPYVLGFKEEVTENGIVYVICDVGSGNFASVVDYTGTATDIEIDTTVDGVVVTGVTVNNILKYAVYKNDILKTITIPSCVSTVDYYAFYDCANLMLYYRGSGSSSYLYVTNFKEEVTENGIVYAIHNDNTATVVKYTGSATNVEIAATVGGNDVTKILKYAFYNKNNLETVIIPKNTTVDSNAFYNCGNLMLYYRGSASNPSSYSYLYVENFKEEVTENGIVYALHYNNEATVVKYTGSATNVEIAETVGGNNVTKILKYAFYDNDNLITVIIPATVTTVDYYAFDGCDNVRLYYKGTGSTYRPYVEYFVEEITDSSGIVYAIYKDGANYKAVVVDYTGTATDIEVLSTIDGETATDVSVVGILEDAFYATSLNSIVIPDGVTYIGDGAFRFSTSLKTITIGKDVDDISFNGTFISCNIEKIIVDEENQVYASDDNGILYNKGKTEIYYVPSAISGDITLASELTQLDSDDFSTCVGITSITIGKNVTSIDADEFWNLYKLQSFVVSEYNTKYASEGGILYEKDNTGAKIKIVCVPTDISGDVILAETLTSINAKAFMRCDKITSITISTSVTSIGEKAFWGCDSLDKVYYGGTKAQWDSISISSTGNEDLVRAVDKIKYNGERD